MCGRVVIRDHILSSRNVVSIKNCNTWPAGLHVCMHACAIATPGKGYVINSSVSLILTKNEKFVKNGRCSAMINMYRFSIKLLFLWQDINFVIADV